MTGAPPIAGAVTLALTLVGVPIVRFLCLRLDLQDVPGPLKIHSRSTPRLGGVAILFAFCGGLFFSTRSSIDLYFVAALVLIFVAGLIDDLRGLSPILRLSAQVLGGIILWYGGWRAPWLNSGALGLAACCVYVVVMVNALNFLDGADGIAAGVTTLVAMAYVLLPGGFLSLFGTLVAWGLLSSCVGFLAFNFPPAKLFMGDSGSTVLGFCIAVLGLDFWRAQNVTASPLLFPILVVLLPLLDALLAVSRRLLRHASPFNGDRLHFYDVLLARGWTPRKVAFVCYGITAACALVGLVVLRMDFVHALSITALSAGVLLFAAARLGSLGTNAAGTQMRRVKI